MIDSHCHLDFPLFVSCLDDLLVEMRQKEVGGFIIPSVKAEDWDALLAFADNNYSCGIALGFHPGFMSWHKESQFGLLQSRLSHSAVVAMGEMGLDRKHKQDDLSDQLELLTAQLKLAKQVQLPVILHARQSFEELYQLVKSLKFDCGGIIHAFTGSEQQAKNWLALGFKLGIGGAVTHPRAKKLRRTVAALPEGAIVLETDSPDMLPAFIARGNANTPLNLPLIAAVVGGLRKETWREVAKQSDRAVLQALPRYRQRFRLSHRDS